MVIVKSTVLYTKSLVKNRQKILFSIVCKSSMTALEFCTPSCKTVLEKYMWSRRLEHYHLFPAGRGLTMRQTETRGERPLSASDEFPITHALAFP